MKRMTSLTALALVFSLFTVTAAIAGIGADSNEGVQEPDPIMKQDRIQASDPVAVCGADDAVPECVPARDQTREETQTRTNDATEEQKQTREETQTRTNDATEEQKQTREQAREQNENRELVAECQAGDPESGCEPLRVETRTQVRESLMERIAAMVAPDGEAAEYRRMFQHVWMYVFGLHQALFL